VEDVGTVAAACVDRLRAASLPADEVVVDVITRSSHNPQTLSQRPSPNPARAQSPNSVVKTPLIVWLCGTGGYWCLGASWAGVHAAVIASDSVAKISLSGSQSKSPANPTPGWETQTTKSSPRCQRRSRQHGPRFTTEFGDWARAGFGLGRWESVCGLWDGRVLVFGGLLGRGPC
jgi:hypothetical protein